VYVFERNGRGVWNQGARVTPENGNDNDHFGKTVGLAEDWLVVGAPLDDDAGVDAGALYIYERTARSAEKDGAWTFTKKQIPAVEPQDFNEFGFSVAVSKEFFVVSSKSSNTKSSDSNTYGNCYVYGTRRPDEPTATPTISLAPTEKAATLAPTIAATTSPPTEKTTFVIPSETPVTNLKLSSGVPSIQPRLQLSELLSLQHRLQPSPQPTIQLSTQPTA